MSTPRVWFFIEAWQSSGQDHYPDLSEAFLTKQMEQRVVFENLYNFAVDVTIFDYDMYQVFTRLWIYRSSLHCHPWVAFGLEGVEEHWCECTEPFYASVVRTFFSNIQRVRIYPGFHVIWTSYFDVGEWPEYVTWFFSDVGYSAPGDKEPQCDWNTGSHRVLYTSCPVPTDGK